MARKKQQKRSKPAKEPKPAPTEKPLEACELCDAKVEFLVGCDNCGKLVCTLCMACMEDDEIEERGELCENCF